MTAAASQKMLTSLRGRCCCLSVAASTLVSVLIILGSSLPTQGNPLVYPNRFSFQKTSTTSTTQVPLHDHDHSNNSISYGSAIDPESGLASSYSRNFRYDIAAWAVGTLLLVGLLFFILYPRMKRRNDRLPSTSSSRYTFPVGSHPKTDLDSSSIIANTN